MPLDLPVLRLVVALAEELSFTRAAMRLHSSQPAVSRQIKRLEAELGVALFERSSSRVGTTETGQAFVAKAREALALIDAAERDAREAAGATRILRVGFISAGLRELNAEVLRVFRARRPGLEVSLHHVPSRDPSAGLLSGEADVALTFAPLEHPALAHRVVRRQPRCFLVAADHPLASRAFLRAADLAGVPCIDTEGADAHPMLRRVVDWWSPNPVVSGARRPIGATVADIDEWVEATAVGAGINSTTLALAQARRRSDLVVVPARGLAPAEQVVAWRRDRLSPAVRAFIQATAHVASAAGVEGAPG